MLHNYASQQVSMKDRNGYKTLENYKNSSKRNPELMFSSKLVLRYLSVLQGLNRCFHRADFENGTVL